MRFLLSALLVLAAASSPAADAVYNLKDFTSQPIIRKATLTPVGPPTGFGNAIIVNEPRTFTNFVDGTFTVTNIAPRAYRVELIGPGNVTIFTNVFPTTISGTVNAKEYISGIVPVIGTYNQAQADGRFVRQENGVSTNQTLNSPTLHSPTLSNPQVSGTFSAAIGEDLMIRTGGFNRWRVRTLGGAIEPNVTDTYDIGSALARVKTIHVKDLFVNGVPVSGGSSTTAGGDLTGTYPNPTLSAVGTPGTYTKVTTDAKGRVISGGTLSATDIPSMAASKITSGIFDVARIPELPPSHIFTEPEAASTFFAGPLPDTSTELPSFRSLVPMDIPPLAYVASEDGSSTNTTLRGTTSWGESGSYIVAPDGPGPVELYGLYSFEGEAFGVTPTDPNHFATKQYVDSVAAGGGPGAFVDSENGSATNLTIYSELTIQEATLLLSEGSVLKIPEDAQEGYVLTSDSEGNGFWAPLPTSAGGGMLFVKTDTTSTTSTSLISLVGSGVGSLTLPADTLVNGKRFRITIHGRHIEHTGGFSQITLKLGGGGFASFNLWPESNGTIMPYPFRATIDFHYRTGGIFRGGGDVFFSDGTSAGVIAVFSIRIASNGVNPAIANTFALEGLVENSGDTLEIEDFAIEALN